MTRLYVIVVVMMALLMLGGLWMVNQAREDLEKPGARAQAMQEILKGTTK